LAERIAQRRLTTVSFTCKLMSKSSVTISAGTG
jgi:hypothetical protein